jgi:two-component system NtrC family sensor kinase
MLDPIPLGYTTGITLTSDAIVIAGVSGHVLFVNPAGVQLFARGDEIIGEPLASLFETSVESSAIHVNRALTEPSPKEGQKFVATVRRPDGERRAVLVRMGPIPGGEEAGGANIGVVAAFQDMTDAFRARQTVAKAEQAQKMEVIGQLVSGVAHELNNPLAAVIAYAQLVLTNRSVPLEDVAAVETILREAKRAAKIVSNLLTFARQHQPERSLTDVNQIVLDTIALRRFTLNSHNIELSVDLSDGLPLAWADSFQLQQVLLNLMTNAEHALQSWQGRRSLKVSTKYDGDRILLVVADSGPGMSEEIIERIFNPFFTTKEPGKGTGLGLAISEGIIREHGGRIRVESAPNAGAAFIVELPYVVPDEAFAPATVSSNSDNNSSRSSRA